MKQKGIEHETWLDLSDAAQYLGVHFTTLRRWADAGSIACIRTPGGRRRFSVNALDEFIQARMQLVAVREQAAVPALQEKAIGYARQSVQSLPPTSSWLQRMNEEQRLRLKSTGHRLMALLLQYNGRSDGGETFLEEGRRITGEYSHVCWQVGLSLPETVQVFLFFRRSILDAIHETGYLGGKDDLEGHRLYHRTTDFLDDMLMTLIHTYQNVQPQISV